MARKTTKAVAVASVRHKDKRKNIPTEELRPFVAADEGAPKTLLSRLQVDTVLAKGPSASW